jgi:hypothetical protein
MERKQKAKEREKGNDNEHVKSDGIVIPGTFFHLDYPT